MRKPPRLHPGDTVAVLSPSWGGPSHFPRVFELGLRNLESLFGLRINEYPTARMDADALHANPQARADDLNRAFADPEVKAIVASIGGDDSVRVLPHLDLDTILAHPKIVMGYSDTTTLTSYLNWNGLVTFNGPSVMAGFAQMRHLPPAYAEHVRRALFGAEATIDYRPYEVWSEGYVDWTTQGYDGEVLPPRPNREGWQWLQGSGKVRGELFGGCIDVLEFLKGTRFWPPAEFWKGKILFFETSEDKPTPRQVTYFLRNYGAMGVLHAIAGLVFGRPKAYSDAEKTELYAAILKVVRGELGRGDLPVVANMDFGHTEPQWVLPLGISAELDEGARTFRLTEACVA